MNPHPAAYFAARIAKAKEDVADDTCISCKGSGQIRDDVFGKLWPCLMCKEDTEPAQRLSRSQREQLDRRAWIESDSPLSFSQWQKEY